MLARRADCMDPLLIVLLGMAIVIGGILLLRWHAFLALTVAAVVVAAIPPAKPVDFGRTAKEAGRGSIGGVVPGAAPSALGTIGDRVAGGFGRTCTSIGILIAMASIVGKCLSDSGAADRIVRTLLALLGEARASLSFLFSGFLLGIPVFFDTVFYLMMPLGRALNRRTGRNYVLYVLSIVAGGTMAHSLVPPTPGPLFVADRLGVDLGTMILAGTAVGLVAAAAGYLFAVWVNGRMVVPLREEGGAATAQVPEVATSALPPLWLALLPILLPVVLIAGNTFADSLLGKAGAGEGWRWWLATLGDKNIALMLAAAIALLTLIRQKRGSGETVGPAVAAALASAGTIILITGAGGAFGSAMRETGVGDRIREITGGHIPLLPLAFAVTVLIRTAQGSATVAMMTAVAIVQDLFDPSTLTFHPVYVALAIGCGSKPLAWMNDSGFWVITRMSGMTEAEALRTVTPMSAVMGLAGLAAILVGVEIFPMR